MQAINWDHTHLTILVLRFLDWTGRHMQACFALPDLGCYSLHKYTLCQLLLPSYQCLANQLAQKCHISIGQFLLQECSRRALRRQLPSKRFLLMAEGKSPSKHKTTVNCSPMVCCLGNNTSSTHDSNASFEA